MAAPSQPNPDDGVVRVTLNTVYQAQLNSSVDLAEIKGTLLLLSQNMSHVIDVGKDHESRLRSLEDKTVTQSEYDKLELRVVDVEKNSVNRASIAVWVTIAIAAAGALATFLSLSIK